MNGENKMKRIITMNMGKGEMIRMVFHNDSGHEWLSCKKKLLKELLISARYPYSLDIITRNEGRFS